MTQIQQACSLWNQSHSALWQISEHDLYWSFKEQPLLHYQWLTTSTGDLKDGFFLLCTATSLGISAGISANTLWVSLVYLPNSEESAACTANELLEKTFYEAKNNKNRIQFGGEEFHFLPGIPVVQNASDKKFYYETLLSSLLKEKGFTPNESSDFSGPLHTPKIDAYIVAAKIHAEKNNLHLQLCSTDNEKKQVLDFLQTNFHGRWFRELNNLQFAESLNDHAFWLQLIHNKNEVIGFARLACKPIPSQSTRTLGAMRIGDADSCLGPIGVDASRRGRGFGKTLLGLSLEFLSQKGAHHLAIDWTNAYEYYRGIGFEECRKHQLFYRTF